LKLSPLLLNLVLASEQALAVLLIGDDAHLEVYQSTKEKTFSSKSIYPELR
jgi:hypothetical protein